MPMPRRSGDVNSSLASSCERRVRDATFSPTILTARSVIFARSSEISGWGIIGSALEAFDGEGGVVPTEAKTIAENSVDVALDGRVGGVVEVELGIGVLVVDRRRNNARPDD